VAKGLMLPAAVVMYGASDLNFVSSARTHRSHQRQEPRIATGVVAASDPAGFGKQVTLAASLALTAIAAKTSRGKALTGSTLRPSAKTARIHSALTRHAMFERFSPGSMKSVMMAQAESRRLGHDRVGTEMLVVGMLAEGNDKGARVMQVLGVKYELAQQKLAEMVGTGAGGKTVEIPFTEGAKQALEDALAKAKDEGNAVVDSGHILRAVTCQDEGLGAKLLGHLLDCSSPKELREKVFPQLETQGLERRPQGSLDGAPTSSDGVVASTSEMQPPDSEEMSLQETLKYSEDLTKAAEEGKLDPLVGRDAQLERTIRILGRRSKNNPVYVGEPGVGKTSIACGLAQRIVQGRVPPSLKDKRVLSLDLALLLAGTRYRGDFEERLRAVVQEVTESNRKVILVIDEVHTLVGAGTGGEGGGMDAANLLKPALARGQLQCIGATTLDEYRKYIEKDPALERRFQPVLCPEPTEEEAELILFGLAPRYERHHQLRYKPEAIKAAVKFAAQYINDRFLPDKAIDVMDEAGSKVRQEMFKKAELDGQAALREELKTVQQEKQTAVNHERYEEAQTIKIKEQELKARLANLENISPASSEPAALVQLRAQVAAAVKAERFAEASKLKAQEREVQGNVTDSEVAWVTEADVAEVVAGWTGVAVEQVSATESAKLLNFEKKLAEDVIGQKEAVASVSRALRRARAGLRTPERPIAALMFSGPTGVGKTQLCKTLSQNFFGSEDTMIRLDMSEFMEKHTVSKLIGSPPGYVGFGEGGTLTEAVRRRPYSLVLFDEVEKAHPDVFNMLLQVLDDGRLTDSKGRVVSFANTMIVMTSNIGSRSVQKGASGGASLGFGTEDSGDDRNYNVIRELVHEEMKSFFRPEFLNRLDEICVFRPLTEDDIRAIAEVQFKMISDRLAETDIEVTVTQRLKDHVVQAGFDPAYGARPLRRAITRLIEDTLAEHLLDSVASDDDPADKTTSKLELDITDDGKAKVRQLDNDSQFGSGDERSEPKEFASQTI